MSIQFSGISSGLPVDQIITQLMAVEHRPIDILNSRKDLVTAQQAQYSAVSSRISALQDALTKLTDASLGSSFDVFAAKTATSSQSAVSATVTNDAPVNNFTVDVLNLATATKATSLSAVGSYTTGASAVNKVAEGAITSGNFTVYVGNQAQTITVDASVDTIQNVVDRIATAISTVTGQPASGSLTADGKIQLSYVAGTSIQFGATGDTTNFAKITNLNSGTDNAPAQDTFTAKYGTSTIDQDATLIGNAVGLQSNTIAAGSFSIGGDTFTIDNTTTLTGLLSQINSSSKANVLISYNQSSNKFDVISKSTGKQAITFDDNGTGFLQSIGLVNGTDTLSSQTLGNNAQFQINGGNVLESNTNAVDSTTSGLTGVTLNLSAKTNGTAANVQVSQDATPLQSAVNDFITKFNAAISFIDQQTAKDGVLNGESSLVRLRNELKTEISDAVPTNSKYKTLFQVGISTGAVNATPGDGAPSSTYSLTASTFLAALADDPTELKKLFIGDGTNKGIINTLKDTVHGSLDPEFGVFSSRDKSANDQIKTINDAITRDQARLDAKEAQLRAQFNAMDQLISQLKSQSGSITSFGLSK